MSKQGKVSPSPFKQAGRFTQDDAARERMKVMRAAPRHDVDGPAPHAPTTGNEAPGLQTPEEPVRKGGPITATARRKAAGSRK